MKSQSAAVATALALACAVPACAQDVVKVSPQTNVVLKENAQVRVIQATFAPGARESTHTHPAGWYYVTMPGKLKITYADGKVEIWDAKTGEADWIDGEAPHQSENVGSTTLQYVMVEVKSAPTTYPNR